MYRRWRHRVCSLCCSWPIRCAAVLGHRTAAVAAVQLGITLLMMSAILITVFVGNRNRIRVVERASSLSKPEVWLSDTGERLQYTSGFGGVDNATVGAVDDDASASADRLNISGDVIVFLHIQKTGGTTFGRHLVVDLDVGSPCVCSSSSAVDEAVAPPPSSASSDYRYSHRHSPLAPTLHRRWNRSSLHFGEVRSTHRGSHHRRQTGSGRKANRLRCDCRNADGSTWLFGRESTGWACGLHADWTELNACVPHALDRIEGRRRERRYLYVTMLRDPVMRYLSEWKHVQRGGSAWLAAQLTCNGHQATVDELPPCFNGSNWSGVTLDEFLSCPHNLAADRQTRMLADLTQVGCYNTSTVPIARRQSTMIANAKLNLQNLAYFGLTERQIDSGYLFERRFGVQFRQNASDRITVVMGLAKVPEVGTAVFNQYNSTRAEDAVEGLSEDEMRRVRRANRLDIELYNFARRLFDKRLGTARMFATFR